MDGPAMIAGCIGSVELVTDAVSLFEKSGQRALYSHHPQSAVLCGG